MSPRHIQLFCYDRLAAFPGRYAPTLPLPGPKKHGKKWEHLSALQRWIATFPRRPCRPREPSGQSDQDSSTHWFGLRPVREESYRPAGLPIHVGKKSSGGPVRSGTASKPWPRHQSAILLTYLACSVWLVNISSCRTHSGLLILFLAESCITQKRWRIPLAARACMCRQCAFMVSKKVYLRTHPAQDADEPARPDVGVHRILPEVRDFPETHRQSCRFRW